ncbi:MAG: hypothetical protein KAS32_13895 [Candidatus Peribacteraceae bacterium]|nr:hypothetical protein [Candidatus Peribacteraceae bacterium]
MVKANHAPKKWVGGDTPFWERKRYVLNQAARELRRKEIDAMNAKFKIRGKRPPLTKEQKLCGARRVI